MIRHINRFYVILILLSLLASCYSFFKARISIPLYPSPLSNTFTNDTLISHSTITSDLDKNTSDRMLSNIHEYNFADGSRLLAVMARVRKRDDFKIETYGLLTKGIDSIYINSPSFSNTIPYSMTGRVNGRESIQTCIIPGTTQLDQVNVQLFPLLFQADRLSGLNQSSIVSKFLGTEGHTDYSCLVLTYQPKTLGRTAEDTWISIIKDAQMALSDFKKL
jgi:hypothetical protein